MDLTIAKQWLEDYKTAWETQSPELIAKLFTSEGQYFETPFLVHTGYQQIYDYWIAAPLTQKDINFQYKIFGLFEGKVIAHWNSKFTRADIPKELDGIFLLDLDAEGKCKVLREWWHSKPITNVE